MSIFGIFGNIENPYATLAPTATGYLTSVKGEGLFILLNNLVKLSIVVAGLYTFWNILTAGYAFLGSDGDSKKVGQAWGKIYQSLLGLAVVAGSFVLAAIFGWLVFNDATALLTPRLFGP